MAGRSEQADELDSAAAKPAAGRDWFGQNSELAALSGPNSASLSKTYDLPQVGPGSTQSDISQTLKQGAGSFDLLQLLAGDRRVVFFGERHDDLGQKDLIISSLKTLKAQDGLTHLALEMLSKSDMPYVESYFYAAGSRQAVLDRLKQKWNIAPGVPEKYMQLIDAIKEAKLIPLALDQPPEGKDDNRGTLFHDRNEHWAEAIAGPLKADSRAKVLVYSGRDHVGYAASGDLANQLLKSEYGYDSTVVNFASRLDPGATIEGKVAAAAQEARLKGRQFALAVDPANQVRPSDIILHPAH